MAKGRAQRVRNTQLEQGVAFKKFLVTPQGSMCPLAESLHAASQTQGIEKNGFIGVWAFGGVLK